MKTKVNKLIKIANDNTNTKILKPITGEYKPGYLYGTVKTHKNDNPLRPIISQIPTPTYTTAKCLNNIITAYLPAKYQINSTDDFLQLIRATNSNGILASMDVESLFTNVPVLTTVDIICDAVYNNPDMPPPPIDRNILKELLLACTTECPFTHMDGKLYIQKDGVSMGSPLGVTFANFYMTKLENFVLENNPSIKPSIYCRFVDDSFLLLNSLDILPQLINAFEINSVLKFTYEIEKNNQINFLDVHIDKSDTLSTSVYNKPTNPGIYLNYLSECPARYKEGTIKALIHRTFKISSNWSIFVKSIDILKQTFINNGYSNNSFDSILNKYLQSKHDTKHNIKHQTHEIFYKNQYSISYKTDERILKSIVQNNIICKDPEYKLKLTIYYNSSTTSNLISKNNHSTKLTPLQQSNLIYEYTCELGECARQTNSYIGMTTTTLSRRLTMHLQSGAIHLHTTDIHGLTLTRETLVNNTKILRTETDYYRLNITEALLIQINKPTINNQLTGRQRTLKLHNIT